MKSVGILMLVICLAFQVHSQDCFLPIDVYDDKHLPVLIDNSQKELQLKLPLRGNIELSRGEKILLSCPNSGNSLELAHSVSADATCVNDETITVLNQDQEYEGVLCSNSLRGTALTTEEICGNGTGHIIKLGFPTENNQFLTLIRVCYDAKNGNALYSTHILYGKEITYAAKASSRPSFSSAELAPGVAANRVYKQATQKDIFSDLLGSAQLASKYINSKSYLTRGHLAPNADFLFTSWKFTTFFYVNTVPQWSADNSGNWNRVETIVKKAAALYQEDFRVFTGGYEVLTLPDINNVDKEIYLSNKLLAVPKYIWKILYSESTGKAIAFITLNNPFLTELKSSDKLCPDICNDYGWGNKGWKKGTNGYVYCCDARNLLKVIPTAPQIDVTGIISAPPSIFTFDALEILLTDNY
ncbi:hypothetical protein WA026_009281 [Henosepilachna vigintioctopunctata]|uniref:Uncharacterized protein n=1 Tax=Henosepilachna vigintioctopunctata TaxID=420089 RepID=A0AAW1UV98_9CUCU